MKKLVLIIFCLLFLVSCIVPAKGQALGPFTLLDAVTSTGCGTGQKLGNDYSLFTVTIKWGGTAPTSVETVLQGSIDGTDYYDLKTLTSTTSFLMHHVSSKPVKWIKACYNSKVGGDATTSVTYKALPGRASR